MSLNETTQQYFAKQINLAQSEIESMKIKLNNLTLTLNCLKEIREELLDKIITKREVIVELLLHYNSILLKEYSGLKEKETFIETITGVQTEI